jgi:hypothetical protein
MNWKASVGIAVTMLAVMGYAIAATDPNYPIETLNLTQLWHNISPDIKVTINWAGLSAGVCAWLAAILPQASAGTTWWLIRKAIDVIGGNILNATNAPKA